MRGEQTGLQAAKIHLCAQTSLETVVFKVF